MNNIKGKRKKIYEHLHTLHIHRKLVREFCFKCGLYKPGMIHDLSKYSLEELLPSIKYYQGNRSPLAYEKELKGYSEAWLRHKGRNKHHWEYWYDFIVDRFQPIEMPVPYLVESICDRIAASKVYLKDKYTDASPLEYLLTKDVSEYMHPNTANEFKRILTYLKDNGEEKTFKMLREMVQEDKKRRHKD